MAATSAVALTAALVGALNGVTAVVSHLFYIPIVLAAYRFLWRGVIYDLALSVSYFGIIAAVFWDAPTTALAAGGRVALFMVVATLVEVLSTTVHDAGTRASVQRDLAAELAAAHSAEEVAHSAVRAVLRLPETDACLAYVRQPDGDYAAIAHGGVSAAFVARVGATTKASACGEIIVGDRPHWDVYSRLSAMAGVDEDEVRRAEGLCGMGVLPIEHDDEMLGSLVVSSHKHFFFSRAEQIAVEIVATQVGAALSRIDTSLRMHRQHAETEVLYTAARELNSTVDYQSVLDRVARQAALALTTDECHIWRHDEDTDSELCLAAYCREDRTARAISLKGMRLALADYHHARDIMLGDTVIEWNVDDPATPPEERRLMTRWGHKTVLHVPLSTAGRSIGRLALVTTQRERHFSPDEVRLVGALGEHAAVAIENARLYAEAAEQNRRLQALLETGRALSSSMDLQQVLLESAGAAAHALDVARCTLCEYEAEGDMIVFRALFPSAAGSSGSAHVGTRVTLREGSPPWRVIHERAVVEERISDPALHPLSRRIMEQAGQRSALSVPLVDADRPLGLLTLIETERDRDFTAQEIELACAVADQAAVAMTNARLYQRVEAQATHDGLTGLFNHRYFYDRLAEELARTRRYGQPLSLLMIDIDDFKLVNDRYGHPVGDEILRAIGQVLSTQARRGVDLAARYGGEEMALILPNTQSSSHEPIAAARGNGPIVAAAGRRGRPQWRTPPALPAARMAAAAAAARERPAHAVAIMDRCPPLPEGALTVAERIRRAIAAGAYATESVPGGVHITVSIGVASFDPDDEDGAAVMSSAGLVARADQALYKAKRSGKDRAIVAD